VRRDRDLVRASPLQHAVLARVLHERLQDEDWYLRVAKIVRDIDAHPKPLVEPNLLDAQISRHEVDFGRQCRFVRVTRVDRSAQHVAQEREGVNRAAGVVIPDKCHDGVQTVEQEVRLQLHA
jgi:hypothetical protein